MTKRAGNEITARRSLLSALYDALERKLGPAGWWPADTPFEVCVGAILTQNAPWSGVVKSITALKNADVFAPETIAVLDDTQLAGLIRPSIYYNQKARRLKTFCRFLLDECEGDIGSLQSMDLHEARERLLALPGIGFETADSILLYAVGMPIFVVDAYTKRICVRHGLADVDWGYERLRAFFEEVFPPNTAFYNEYHGLLCIIGATYCRPKPVCRDCPVHTVLGDPVL